MTKRPRSDTEAARRNRLRLALDTPMARCRFEEIAPSIRNVRRSPIQVLIAPTLLNFGDRTRTGVFSVVWTLAIDHTKTSIQRAFKILNIKKLKLLSSGDNEFASTTVNSSMVGEVCGAAFLPSADAEGALPQQPPEKIRTIVGVYLGCMAAASLTVALLVDSLKRYDAGRKGSGTGLSGWKLLATTTKLMREPNQMLLMVITTWIGLEQAFFGADFTAAFVSCPIGTGWVGYVMMTFGVSNALSCLATGCLVKLTGRLPLMCAATALHTSLLLTLLLWKPHPYHPTVQYAVAVLWGICDSIWMVQINAYCGILFPSREEAAYANFRLWESFGFIIAYSYSPYLRTDVKLYIVLGLMITGVMCYLTVEYRECRRKKEALAKKKEICRVKGFDNIAFQNSPGRDISTDSTFDSNTNSALDFDTSFAFNSDFLFAVDLSRLSDIAVGMTNQHKILINLFNDRAKGGCID
ncbi:UNC93-like protein [Eumeta japonica]|uniref:UNC93-like protein n=1 Tax=Eumeta variegata TaxID=151549 RepID=A0A4C1Y703_EUMVA|nr:UNC93-like protein [Eumeta japonica]